MGSRDVLKHPGEFFHIQDKYNEIKNRGSAIKQPRFDLYVFSWL